MMSLQRRAATLVEVLVAVGILAVLIGLLIPAIARVRQAALRAQSMNNLRQIALATHHLASQRQDRLPTDERGPYSDRAMMGLLLPYLESGMADARAGGRVRVFISPADPTVDRVGLRPPGVMFDPDQRQDVTSYAYNALIFDKMKKPALSSAIPDGLANTIIYAERYARCDIFTVCWSETGFMGMSGYAMAPRFGSEKDIKTEGEPPFSRMRIGGRDVTFQVRPCAVVRFHYNGIVDPPPECGSRPKCNYLLNQTPHSGGMLAAMADGSIRTIRPDIDPTLFWGVVTPNGGEVLGD